MFPLQIHVCARQEEKEVDEAEEQEEEQQVMEPWTGSANGRTCTCDCAAESVPSKPTTTSPLYTTSVPPSPAYSRLMDCMPGDTALPPSEVKLEFETLHQVIGNFPLNSSQRSD